MLLEMRASFPGRPGYEFFDRPKPGENVWPHQGCPCFSVRWGAFPDDPGRECWYCRHADFRLTEQKALQVGVCKFAVLSRQRE